MPCFSSANARLRYRCRRQCPCRHGLRRIAGIRSADCRMWRDDYRKCGAAWDTTMNKTISCSEEQFPSTSGIEVRWRKICWFLPFFANKRRDDVQKFICLAVGYIFGILPSALRSQSIRYWWEQISHLPCLLFMLRLDLVGWSVSVEASRHRVNL